MIRIRMRMALALMVTALAATAVAQACVAVAAAPVPGGTGPERGSVALAFPGADAPRLASTVRVVDTFTGSSRGWEPLFVDLPADAGRELYALDFGVCGLPAPLDRTRRGLCLAGDNRSDDLAMFVTKGLGRGDGIKPGTRYRIDFDFDVATDAPADAMGIGGGPGNSVFVKAGAVATAPGIVAVRSGTGVVMARANFDHGRQMSGGRDVVVLGDLAKQSGSEDSSYEIRQYTNAEKSFYATADGEGRLWLVMGTDSGYEGSTRIYLPRISVTLTPVQP